MSWDFSTDPDFEPQLEWTRGFVRDEVEPLETLGLEATDDVFRAITAPMKAAVKERGLWATHLGPELGGQGFGQVKLALLNEILGRTRHAPEVFGCQAPDTGNAEILALYGTEDQKAAVPGAAAGRADPVVLLDDRAERRLGPDAAGDPGLPGRGRVGARRPQVVLLERGDRRVPDRDGRDRPGRASPTGARRCSSSRRRRRA